MLPNGLACFGVHAEEKRRGVGLASSVYGFVSLQDRQVELAGMESGRRGKGPLKTEIAIVFLYVASPKFLASHIVGNQVPVAVRKDDEVPVGNGGSACIGRLGIELIIKTVSFSRSITTSGVLFPEDFSS